ncbi:serine/threonine-protein kinase AfsK [Streptomyces viridiviolaceus]|uniref:PQQ-binding-like beta-propeller repeat protein n=1 Tax=Streptomyces viridiviolaceus TaxID=68282 RepID=A0ABW2DYW7_9ACTN|nr:PQQ-binding-like beta-propeller repeat protein [Streptomyces viridiviolaceus]GHB43783.1 serine/threonine-protein kinase AfsK [Streptomyces viridiviolaceus]
MGVTGLTPEDPAAVGDFELLGRLGAGGFGTVYLGLTAGGRRVAVKTVHRHIADHDGFRARFRREVEALRRAGGFFTAPLVDADPGAPLPWLATEYVPGPDLGTVVARGGPLAPEAVWRLGTGLCEALATLHGVGLVHRDLKPSNVLLAEDGPRVIDFGIASLTDATRLTVTHEAAGTPGYAAPEQLRGMRDVGPAADVFALTCLLVYAGSGRGPFRGGTLVEYIAHVLHEPPDLSGLDAPLAALAQAGLALDPGARPALPELAALCAERVGRAGAPRPFADLLAPAVRDLLAGAEAEASAPVPLRPTPPAPGARPGRDAMTEAARDATSDPAPTVVTVAAPGRRPTAGPGDSEAPARHRPWAWTAPAAEREAGPPEIRGPAVADTRDGGGVVCVAADGRLHGLDAATGAERWTADTGFETVAAGPVAAGDVFVVADDTGRVSGHRATDGGALWARWDKPERSASLLDGARLLVTDTPQRWVALRHARRDMAPETVDHSVPTWEHIHLLDPATGEHVTAPFETNDQAYNRWGTTIWVSPQRLFVQGYRQLVSLGLATDTGARWRERADASVSLGERVVIWSPLRGLTCRDGATGTVLWRSRRPRGAVGAVSGSPDGAVVAVVTNRGTWAFAARTGRSLWTASVPGGREKPLVVHAGIADGVLWSVMGRLAFAHDAADGRLLWRTETEHRIGFPTVSEGGLLFLDDSRRLHVLRLADGHEVWSDESSGSCPGDHQPHWAYGDLLYLRGYGGVSAHDVRA